MRHRCRVIARIQVGLSVLSSFDKKEHNLTVVENIFGAFQSSHTSSYLSPTQAPGAGSS
jgi:hypothetical protein